MTRKEPSSNLEAEAPSSLLIRRKGGNIVDVDEFAINTDISSTLIAYEMSRRGLGPKMYGIFKGGTVEEFIDSHTLKSEESKDPDISRDIAISIAKVHAIKGLPLKQTVNEDNIASMKEWSKMIPSKRDYIQNNKNLSKYNLDIEFLYNFDYATEIDWIDNQFKTRKMRKNFILNDMNYLNCLVKNNPKDGELRVMLIDYDIGHYDYRGIDIGIHFFNRRFQVEDKDNKIIPNSTFPTTEEKKRFIKIYQDEIKKLNVWNDFDENGIDSVDNLLIESMIGQLQYTLYFGIYMMAKPEIFFDLDPSFSPCLEFMLKHYVAIKKDCCEDGK